MQFKLINPQHSGNSTSKNRVTEENKLTSIFHPQSCLPLCTPPELQFPQEHFFNYDVSKLFNLKIQTSLVLEGKWSEILNCKC